MIVAPGHVVEYIAAPVHAVIAAPAPAVEELFPTACIASPTPVVSYAASDQVRYAALVTAVLTTGVDLNWECTPLVLSNRRLATPHGSNFEHQSSLEDLGATHRPLKHDDVDRGRHEP